MAIQRRSLVKFGKWWRRTCESGPDDYEVESDICCRAEVRNFELEPCRRFFLQHIEPPAGTRWRVPETSWRPGQIIRHGDLGPWNIVWSAGEPIGIIDWDFAEPGYPIEDIAQLAWHAVPLGTPKKCLEAGVEPGRVQMKRLRRFCEFCGANESQVIEAVCALQQREVNRIVKFGRAGLFPWCFFLERGDVEEIREELSWSNRHRLCL